MSKPGTSVLACGGTIDVLVEPGVPSAAVEAATESLGAGGLGAAVVTPLPADSPPAVAGPHEPGEGAPPEPKSSSMPMVGLMVRSATSLTIPRSSTPHSKR
jgi:hypothetical protein